MSNNLRIIYNNWTDTAALSLVSGSTQFGFQLSALKSARKGVVWRSTGTSATIQLDFTQDQVVGGVMLPFCNLSKTATLAVQLYTAAGSLISTTTSNPAAPFQQLTQAQWGALPNGVTSYAYGGGAQARCWITPTSCRRVRVAVSDTSNQQGYLELSRLVVGDYWSPTYNTEFGLAVGYKDFSTQQRTEAGSLITSTGILAKTLKLNLSYMTATDRTQLLEIVRGVSTKYPVFLSTFPLDSDMEREGLYQVYGKFVTNPTINHPLFSIYTTTLELEEV
jgi:hypothetical protein